MFSKIREAIAAFRKSLRFNIRPPLYALLVAPDEKTRNAIIYGQISATIRTDHRDYEEGQSVMLCCHLDPWVVFAIITNVRHCTLNEISKDEVLECGFNTREEVIQGLRKYYPDLNQDSPITFIKWNNVQGWLVDHQVLTTLQKVNI